MNKLQGASAPFLVFAALLFSCGGESDGNGPEVRAGEGSVASRAPSIERDESEAARKLRRALDICSYEELPGLFEAAGPTLGMELLLLEARLFAIDGEDLKVTRKIEEARALAPNDQRVYATAAELHAASGRLDTARDEIRRGLEVCGSCAELLRSQAFVQLSQAGGASRGLNLLERALIIDPGLPFTGRARGQAHLLLAKSAMAERRTKTALKEARLSLECDPEDVDARVFFADVLSANGEFPSAALVLEELKADGFGREGELALMYKRAAMGELILRNRDRALEYFRLARTTGLSDEELGSGAEILRDAAIEATKQGVQALEGNELETARMRFEHALRLDGSLLVARSQLAALLFQEGKNLPAATHWRLVLDVAIEEGLELPDPIHIFLAKALHKAGELPAARAVLEAYLEREEDGRWASATTELLAQLP